MLLFFTVFLLLSNFSFSQNDTSYHHYNQQGTETTADSAFYYLKLYRENNQWYGREYYKKNNALKSEGNYAGNDGKTPTGTFKNYKNNGILDFNGRL